MAAYYETTAKFAYSFSCDCSAFKSKYAQQTSVLHADSTTVKRKLRGEVLICQTDLNIFRHVFKSSFWSRIDFRKPGLTGNLAL